MAVRAGLTSSVVVCLAALAVFDGSAQEHAPILVDRTKESGLDFSHVNGAAGELRLPEVIGAGGALFDYDNDGDLDVYLVQGAGSGGRLFRNDLRVTPGTRSLHFTDVTEASGIVARGYGMGAATGDFDNDGCVDLYLTHLRGNQLLHNNCNGTFTDVTEKSGTGDQRWSTSATFFDYDRDGWLDLYVAHYVDFRADMKRTCFSAGSARDYCNPVVYPPVADRLLHNDRNGTFSDVSARAGLTRSPARGLGVLASDINGDGWIDIYVANDGDPNRLWINQQGTGVFKDEGLLAGVALNRAGQAQGSMGIDLGDIDGDGDEDLFVTNLDNEANTLYVNVGRGLFEDRTVEHGLFKLGFTGFGTRFIDYDSDGWLDLIVANGAVRHLSAQVQKGDPYPLKQRSQLFHNDRRGTFVDVSAAAGPAFAPMQVARGIAAGDLDNDGSIDIVIFNNSGPARVLMNEVRARGHWLGVRAIDPRYHRDALQSRVELAGRGGRNVVRRVQVDGSYCTASDPRVMFGLGDDQSMQTVRVQWGPGDVEEFRGLAVDRYWILERGKAAKAS